MQQILYNFKTLTFLFLGPYNHNLAQDISNKNQYLERTIRKVVSIE